MRPVNRITPNMPASAYQTYAVTSPRDTAIPAACEQVDCAARRHGWESKVDEATDLGKAQAHYIRTQSGRTFKEQRTEAGLTVFRFESGQRCFANHQTRPETYSVLRGDWRSSSVERTHIRPADWVEDFALHQQKLADRLNQG